MGVPVCVLTFKALLVVLCVLLSHPPTLLGPCVRQAEPWSTLEAATVATSNSLSSKCKFEWSKKHRKLGSFFLPSSTLGPFIYFTGPLCLSVCWRSTLHPSSSSLPCVAIACCSMLPSPTFGGLCLHLSLHKMDNEENMYCILSAQFSLCLAYSLWLSLPLSLVHKLLISGEKDLERCFWDTYQAMKKHWHPPLNMAPELEDNKTKKRKENTNGKEKNCLIRASGEEVGNTYAHPWFLPGRPPRQQFSSFLTIR